MVARRQARRDGADGRHARGERERRPAAFDRREVGFERRPRRVLRARVLEALVLAERVLDVGRRLEDRRDDRAGRRIRFLTGVKADRLEIERTRGVSWSGPGANVCYHARSDLRMPDNPPPSRRRSDPQPSRPVVPAVLGPAAAHRCRYSSSSRCPNCLSSSGAWSRWRFIGSLVWLGSLAIARNRRAFLWRVRRKLLLSYVFLGFVPVVLIAELRAGRQRAALHQHRVLRVPRGLPDVRREPPQIAETSATEIGRNPAVTQAALERKYANLSGRLRAVARGAARRRAGRGARRTPRGPSPPLRSGPGSTSRLRHDARPGSRRQADSPAR